MMDSNSSLSIDQNILDPRPSIAKTSISITKTDKDGFSKNISRLRVASGYLKPVIDEIISRATSYTQLEFRELLETKSPICSISVEQFTKACRASEIIGENPYLSEYIVNTLTQSNDDRIFIDRDLLKQLVDLQTAILETIKKLKDNVFDDMEIEDVRKSLEDNFVIVDKVDGEAKQRNAEEQLSKLSGVQTLTVKNCNRRMRKHDLEKVSEMTAQLPTSSDFCVEEPLEGSGFEYVNSDRNCAAMKADDESELILKTEINDADNTVPQTIKEEQCDCDGKPEHAGCRDEGCRVKMLKFEKDLDDVKLLVRNLTDEVDLLKGKNKTNQRDSATISRNVPQEDLEYEILDCLKELRQIKDALGRMNNPELTLDRPSREDNQPCCKLCDFPHIHARLNGIPVIIKLNKSSIDILLSEQDRRPEHPTQERKCLCRTTKQQEAMIVTKVESYVHTKYNTGPFQQIEHENEREHEYEQEQPTPRKRTVVQSAFTHHIGSELEFCESIEGLPYTVNKKSLPSINICPSMNIDVDQLKKNMRSEMIEHPKNRVQKHLAAFGVDNLIKASIPAECCRKAVINEADRDDEPFHASINSLPLSTSDLKMISEQQRYMHQLEYYTNFQENLASNIDYYLPKSRVYEVRFFRVFRKEPKSKTSLAERLSEVLRRIIYNDVEANTSEAPPKLMRNKKCQTEEKKAKPPRSVTHKCKKGSLSKGKSRSSSVQCKIGDVCDGDGLNQKSKHKNPSKPSEKPIRQQYYNSNQSIFACNTNLGTIYESEERHHRRKTKNRLVKNKEPSLSDFLNSPSVTDSFQKFLATEAAAKAVDGEQFWAMYFEAKKSHRETGSQDNFQQESSISLQRRRYGKYRKSSVSRIPRRIVKHTFSSTSSDVSTVKTAKTQERIEKNELVVKVKPKHQPVEKKSEEIRNRPPSPSTPTISILELASKYKAEISKNSNIFSEDNLQDSPSTDCNRVNSLESLQLLASKNGPGYITVLHPICGCPEVSIFIPCYCQENSRSVLSREVVQKLVCRNDGRHIILPKGCRVEKCEGSCNDGVKED